MSRSRTPTAMQKRAGWFRPSRSNPNEPRFAAADGPPEPPEWLSGAAADEWRRLSPELHALGLLPAVSLMLFAAYCSAFASWREAEDWLAEHGRTLVMKDRDGCVVGVRELPQSKIAREERAAMRRFAAEFGLSPGTSASVSAREKPKASTLLAVTQRRIVPSSPSRT